MVTYQWEDYTTTIDGETVNRSRIKSLTDYSGRKVTYGYNSANQLATINDVLGHEWTLHYNGTGRAAFTGFTNAENQRTTFEVDSNGSLRSYRMADGVGASYRYQFNSSKDEHYVREESTTGAINETWFNRLGQVNRRKVNGDEVTSASVTLSDNSSDASRVGQYYTRILKTKSAAATQSVTRQYQSQAEPYVRQRQQQDSRGASNKVEYDRMGNITRREFPDGTVTTAKYNSQSRMIESVDVDGVKTLYAYDTRGNLTRMTEAAGTPLQRITNYTYNTQGKITAVTWPGDATLTFTWDDLGNLATVTDPLGQTTAYQYDVLGNVTQITDARDQVWSATYDNAGNLLSTTNPLGDTSQWQYDKAGRVIKILSPDDAAMNLELNASGLPTAIIDAASDRTEFTYDKGNRLTALVDPLKHETLNEYDSSGRLIKQIDGVGDQLRYEYDQDRLTTFHQPGASQSFEYDKLGRIGKIIRRFGPDSEPTVLQLSRSYYRDDSLKAATDTNGNSTGYTYDLLDRLTTVTDAMGGTTRYRYDERGNLASVVDPQGAETRFEYNLRNELITETKVGKAALASTHRRFAYDAVGNLITMTSPGGEQAVYTYDAANQLINEAYYPDAAARQDNRADYQADYQYNNIGALARYTDGTTRATYQYDNLYQLTGATVTFNLGKANEFSKTYQYTYQPNGVPQSYTNPENIRYDYRTDKANRLTAVMIPGQGRISYNRYQWQMPVHISYPGGTIMTQTVDGLMRLTSRTVNDPAGNPVSAQQWFYDGESNLLKLITREEQVNYAYDNLYRLTGAVYNKQPGDFIPDARSDENYQYDGVGNRTRSTVNQTEDTSSYNAFNQLIQQGDASSGYESFEYDTNGNLIKRGKRNSDQQIAIDPTGAQPYWQYLYDSRERLIEVRKDGNTLARYGYNPMGERIKKEIVATGTVTHYLYNDQGLIGEYDDNGQLIQEYGWKPQSLWSTDPLFTRTVDSASGKTKVHYYLNDHSGQPQRAFTRNGAITWQARSSSYGQATISDKSTLTNNLRLPGQYFDSETGLHYNWFRYYDPSLGRYLRNDPTGLYGGLNAYAYGLGNPLLYADNNGQLPILIPIIANMARYAIRKFAGCFLECAVGAGVGILANEVWQSIQNDCPSPVSNWQSGLGAAVAGCATGCLRPWNWIGSKAKALGAKIRARKVKINGTDNVVTSVKISRKKYPESARHIEDAQVSGHPKVLTIDRAGKSSNRRASLKGVPTKKGLDRDEYPPAMFKEGGGGASVRHIPRSDNRGSGASFGAQCRGLSCGSKVQFDIVD
ncbi:RHS repeat-associated core domain-containing protein [Endozoicomonas ascidiicola]|uniref:RHS repeat-associated core domain-containing protein n=1 Tax=Endozoicomonas ascidiicola TaxID=1698521 RepID=UPI001C12B2E7|nr:RHS repeat-associated core domain-containing protein [Endozoicomonas ascidiicola]